MTVGPPTVGKTTLKEQLLTNSKHKQKKRKRQAVRAVQYQPPSTPVCESVKKIEVTLNDNKQSCSTFAVDNYTWKSLTLDEEFIARLKGLTSKNVIDDDVTVSFSGFIMFMYMIIAIAPLADGDKQERTLISQDDNIVQFMRILVVLFFVSSFIGIFLGLKGQRSQWIKSSRFNFISAETVARDSIENSDIQKIQPEFDQNFNIYFRDCGGQPEFHEVLPALVSHSTMFFFVFKLSEGLNNRYKVTYRTSDGDVSVPYESSFTVKEALLQCLASISSIGKYLKPRTTIMYKIKSMFNVLSEKVAQFFKENLKLPISKVIIIGTHKDKLLKTGGPEDKILQTNNQLEDELKGTDWYSQDMVVPTESGMVLLGINSFNSNDIKLLKSMVVKVALNGDYQVKIPVPWLALDFCIRKLEKKVVMSLTDCQDLALDCNISLGDEFNAALWFLHKRVGTIRYFNVIPELKDVVITDPQVLFDIVTDIIVNTFSFGKRIHRKSEHDRFRLSGRFTKYHLEQCKVVKENLLLVEQVIAVLKHLVIIAPVGINECNEQEYFLPCVLVHASLPCTQVSQNDGDIPPLLITFKCHYTPRGIFSSLIAKILLDGKDKWELSSEEIFRDQIDFNLVKSGHIVTVTNFFRFLEIVVKSPDGFTTRSENVYVSVQHYISHCLTYVKNQLNYTDTANHFFGFYCKRHKNRSIEDHPAICNNDCPKYTTCSRKGRLKAYLSPQEQLWFNEKSEFALFIDLY